MTEEVQDQELHDEVTDEVVEEAHDPKNAEAQSVAATDKAGDATGSAPKRKGDQTKQDPMPKTKAALMAGMVKRMGGMNKSQLMAMYKAEGFEDLEGEVVAESEKKDIEVSVDFSQPKWSQISCDSSDLLMLIICWRLTCFGRPNPLF